MTRRRIEGFRHGSHQDAVDRVGGRRSRRDGHEDARARMVCHAFRPAAPARPRRQTAFFNNVSREFRTPNALVLGTLSDLQPPVREPEGETER